MTVVVQLQYECRGPCIADANEKDEDHPCIVMAPNQWVFLVIDDQMRGLDGPAQVRKHHDHERRLPVQNGDRGPEQAVCLAIDHLVLHLNGTLRVPDQRIKHLGMASERTEAAVKAADDLHDCAGARVHIGA